MKKYYIIENQIDTEEVGLNISSQTDGLVGEVTFNRQNSYRIFTHHNLPDEFKPLETIKLANSAKQTDFISTGLITGNGFIVSSAVKNILEQQKVVKHKFYKIPIVHRHKEIEGYYWFHMYHPQQDYINFQKSIFQVRRFSKVIKDEIRFNSIDDYWNQRTNYKSGELFRIKHIYLKPNNFDFLYIGVGGSIKLISEELHQLFKQEKITGYKITELKNIEIENHR